MSRRSRYYLAKSADTGKCGNKAGLPSTVGVSLAQRRSFMSNLQWKQPCCKPKKCEISRFRKTPLEDPMSDVKIANVEYTGANGGGNVRYQTFKVTLTDDLKIALNIGSFEIKVDGTAIVPNVNGTPTKNELSFDLNQNMFLETAGAELSVKLLEIDTNGDAVEDSNGHELDTQVEVKKQLTPDITYSLLGLNKGALPVPQQLTITLIAGKQVNYGTASNLVSVDLGGVNYPLNPAYATDHTAGQQFDVTLDYTGKSMTEIEGLFNTAANASISGIDATGANETHTVANAVPAYENYLSFFVNFSKPVGNNSNLPLEKENLAVKDQNNRPLVISKLEYVGDHLSSGVTYKVTLGSITNTGDTITLNVEQNVNGVFIHHFKNGVAVTEGNGGIVSQAENAQETI